MADEAGYARPPIVEAHLELFFDNQLSAAQIASLEKSLASRYPEKQEEIEFEFAVGPGAPSAPRQQVTGARYVSADQSEIALIRTGSIIITQLAPYPGWTPFFGRFLHLYGLVRKQLDRVSVTRIGLRYVNRIDLPDDGSGVIDTQRFVRSFPAIPPGAPMTGWMLQVERPVPGTNLISRIICGTAHTPVPKHTGVALDIDVICMVDVPRREDDMMLLMGQMRDVKNMLFEQLITDDSRNLFS